MSHAPVLIVFGREPAPGLTKSRLIPHLGARNAAALADAFMLDAIARARAIRGVRLVIAGSAEDGARASRYFRRLARDFDAELVDQGDGTLGRRMARVMEPYASGGGALLIGTDTPTLPAPAISRLCAMLRTRRVVIGPSLDGGYYAIGVRGALPPVFTGIRWGRNDVLANTLSRLGRAHMAAAIGPAWYDVDTWPDLLMLAAHLGLIASRCGAIPCPATAAVLRRLGLLTRHD